jgi:DNA-directed RNA polymerase specialized sigma24 family protein
MSMNTVTAIDIWHASQSRMVQSYAWNLWRTEHGRDDGLQEALCYALSRKAWFDAAKGQLETWLILILKSIRNQERFKGHRRGTVSAPRVVCPGDEAIPVMVDLCDPESILIARELDLNAEADKRERHTNAKLSAQQVLAIRASTSSQKQLASQYNVSTTIISAVRCRITYKNVVG